MLAYYQCPDGHIHSRLVSGYQIEHGSVGEPFMLCETIVPCLDDHENGMLCSRTCSKKAALLPLMKANEESYDPAEVY